MLDAPPQPLVQIDPGSFAPRAAPSGGAPALPALDRQSRLTGDLHVLPLEGERYLIYAPLRRAAFIGNASMVRVLRAVDEGRDPSTLDPQGQVISLLQRLQMLDAGAETLPPEANQGAPQPGVATLLLTTACNLRCTYCYASAGDTALEFMSMDVARNGIDHVVGNALRLGLPYFGVAFHGGGEPTANWKVLVGAVEYALEQTAQHGIGAHFNLTTNGVFSEEKAAWIAQHIHSVSVSFDGVPGMHDAHRKQADGSGSSEIVERSLRVLTERGVKYGIRMTVTADQIGALPDSVDYICRNFRPVTILVEPIYQMGRGERLAQAESELFIEAFRQARGRARSYGHALQFSGARLGIVSRHFCGVTQDNFCLSAKGNVSACYEVFSETSQWASKFFYGRPTGKPGEYFVDLQALEGLRAQTVERRSFCDGCFAKWTCGGDCYHKALTTNGDADYRGAGRCHVIRELTKDMILDRISSSGGLFWHEPVEAPHA